MDHNPTENRSQQFYFLRVKVKGLLLDITDEKKKALQSKLGSYEPPHREIQCAKILKPGLETTTHVADLLHFFFLSV